MSMDPERMSRFMSAELFLPVSRGGGLRVRRVLFREGWCFLGRIEGFRIFVG